MEHLIAALTACLAGLGAYFAGRARNEAKNANRAVNNTGGSQPRIYDMIFDLHDSSKELVEWKRSYEGGPLDSGPKVVEFVSRVDRDLGKMDVTMDRLDIRLNEAMAKLDTKMDTTANRLGTIMDSSLEKIDADLSQLSEDIQKVRVACPLCPNVDSEGRPTPPPAA